MKSDAIGGVGVEQLMLLLVLSVMLPAVLLLALLNSVLPFSIGQVTTVRWLLVAVLPVVVAAYGLRKKSLVLSGALTGIVLTQALMLAHYGFLAQLFVFFVAGSRVTRYRAHRKRLLEEGYREGGGRNGLQVLCTAGAAAVLSVLYLLECGSGEHWLDLHNHRFASCLCLAVLGSFSCAAGDTFSSEVGSVVGTGDPLLITSFRRVPRGTNGGVSAVGTAASALGGTLVGLAHYLTLAALLPTLPPTSPPQHCLVWLGTLGGVLGSLLDSLLGATLQYSGLHPSGMVVSRPGRGVVHITGKGVMSNTTVNLVSGVITAVTIPALVMLVY